MRSSPSWDGRLQKSRSNVLCILCLKTLYIASPLQEHLKRQKPKWKNTRSAAAPVRSYIPWEGISGCSLTHFHKPHNRNHPEALCQDGFVYAFVSLFDLADNPAASVKPRSPKNFYFALDHLRIEKALP